MTKDLVKLGSKTAKQGFRNESDVVARFNNWKHDDIAKSWLSKMDYKINDIESVTAYKVTGRYKSDVQVQVEIKLKQLIDTQNLQVKLVSNPSGFNQIDKRWVDKYVELWNMPDDVAKLLKYFTGEIEPYITDAKDNRRMFVNEFSEIEQKRLLDFFISNKMLIVSDILKGRGKFAAEWMLVILRLEGEEMKWALEPINYVLNLFGNGDIVITERGSIKIGNITIQRKGGDGGRKTAQMLQFKINPCRLFLN